VTGYGAWTGNQTYWLTTRNYNTFVKAWHSRSSPNSCSSGYNGCLVTRAAVRLTVAKLKPLIFPAPRAALRRFPCHKHLRFHGFVWPLFVAFTVSSRYDRRSVGQSVLVSRSHLGPNTRFSFTVRQLRVCWCGAPSLTRGWDCRLQMLLDFASAVILGSESWGLMTTFYCLRFENPKIGGSSKTGWPSYTPRHWVPTLSPPTTRRAPSPHGLRLWLQRQSQSQSHVKTDDQSACLSWCQAPIWCPKPDGFREDQLYNLGADRRESISSHKFFIIALPLSSR
jgi:hypothetical protein